MLPLRLKSPSQPLVFCFTGVSSLCTAITALYEAYPNVSASLCLWEEKYFLAVHSRLKTRRAIFCILTEYADFLGPGSVIYSFYEEHGKNISQNAVAELGAAMHFGK